MKLFKHYELELLKVGKVSKHSTKTRGKILIKKKFIFLIMPLQIKITSFMIWEIYQSRKYLAQLRERAYYYSSQSTIERRDLLDGEETLEVRAAR